jgi:hypothetical protein
MVTFEHEFPGEGKGWKGNALIHDQFISNGCNTNTNMEADISADHP